MKLSEAIHLGCKKKEQGFETYYNEVNKCTCVLGAAIDGIGELDDDYNFITSSWVLVLFPILMKYNRATIDCPVKLLNETSCGVEEDLMDTIVHLNDDHKWTREKIADWLEENYETK